MAGQIVDGMCIDYHDGEGSARVNGKIYRWEFTEYAGPLFVTAAGEPLKNQPGERHEVWDAFRRWLGRYYAARKTTPSHMVVEV